MKAIQIVLGMFVVMQAIGTRQLGAEPGSPRPDVTGGEAGPGRPEPDLLGRLMAVQEDQARAIGNFASKMDSVSSTLKAMLDEQERQRFVTLHGQEDQASTRRIALSAHREIDAARSLLTVVAVLQILTLAAVIVAWRRGVRRRRPASTPAPCAPTPSSLFRATTRGNGQVGAPDALAIPPVVVSRPALDRLAREIARFRSGTPGVETGYALVGTATGDGASRVIRIQGILDAGPSSTRSPGAVTFDRAYQQAELEVLQCLWPGVGHVGDAHLHPGSLDRCSSVDFKTDLGNVRASATQEMVFAIATAVETHASDNLEGAILREGLKLDFYYLGKASGYRYARIQPRIAEDGLLEIAPALRAWIVSDPTRARLELEVLRRLPGFSVSLMRQDGAASGFLVSRNDIAYDVAVVFDPDSGQPSVCVRFGGDLVEYRSDVLDSPYARHAWLAGTMLEIVRDMARLYAAAA